MTRRAVKLRAAAALGATLLMVLLLVAGCVPRRESRDVAATRGIPVVRVALGSRLAGVPLGATRAWILEDARGETVVRWTGAGSGWRVERRGTELRALNDRGDATPWSDGSFTLRAERGALVEFNSRRYRGELRVIATEAGLTVINLLPLEEYLRGVVPLEIGPRDRADHAAVEAQAVAARSFTVTRMRGARTAAYDLVASTADQVYGGVVAERQESDAAIRATAGLVLLYGGAVVDAPFHSTCGGETAAAEEVWSSAGQPHLKRVSDRIPGAGRYYCDIAPRFYWERSLSGDELDAVAARYLDAYARVPASGPGAVRSVRIAGRTPSGRVAALELRTVAGEFTLRGNDARSVLRTLAGELLPSSYFSVATEAGPGGRIARLVVRGNGFGHGVGMCQWGAVGRARAGQSARSILRVYYPGTTIGPLPSGYLTP